MSHVFTGTATDYQDLLDKVVGHLTDGASMGAEVWSLLLSRNVGGVEERYLKATGLAGADQIYINIRTSISVGGDFYNWDIRGALAHNPAFTFDLQPGLSPSTYKMLWQSAIPYTLVANGRRFMLIAKVSNRYMNTYAGLYLPYATSAENPYPLYIGSTSASLQRWSVSNYNCGSFYDPNQSAAWLRHFDGSWVNFWNYIDNSGTRNTGGATAQVWPFLFGDVAIGNNQDTNYSLLQCILCSSQSGGNIYGELQGAYFVSGFGNAAENTITIAGKTYLVTQNVQRTSRIDYAAILLE